MASKATNDEDESSDDSFPDAKTNGLCDEPVSREDQTGSLEEDLEIELQCYNGCQNHQTASPQEEPPTRPGIYQIATLETLTIPEFHHEQLIGRKEARHMDNENRVNNIVEDQRGSIRYHQIIQSPDNLPNEMHKIGRIKPQKLQLTNSSTESSDDVDVRKEPIKKNSLSDQPIKPQKNKSGKKSNEPISKDTNEQPVITSEDYTTSTPGENIRGPQLENRELLGEHQRKSSEHKKMPPPGQPMTALESSKDTPKTIISKESQKPKPSENIRQPTMRDGEGGQLHTPNTTVAGRSPEHQLTNPGVTQGTTKQPQKHVSVIPPPDHRPSENPPQDSCPTGQKGRLNTIDPHKQGARTPNQQQQPIHTSRLHPIGKPGFENIVHPDSLKEKQKSKKPENQSHVAPYYWINVPATNQDNRHTTLSLDNKRSRTLNNQVIVAPENGANLTFGNDVNETLADYVNAAPDDPGLCSECLQNISPEVDQSVTTPKSRETRNREAAFQDTSLDDSENI